MAHQLRCHLEPGNIRQFLLLKPPPRKVNATKSQSV